MDNYIVLIATILYHSNMDVPAAHCKEPKIFCGFHFTTPLRHTVFLPGF